MIKIKVKNANRIIIYIVLIFASILILLPVYWMLKGSFSTLESLYRQPPEIWPVNPTIDNYKFLLGFFPEDATQYGISTDLFPRSILNSLVVTIVATIVGIFLCSITGFAFAKYRFKGKDVLFFAILGMIMIPQVAIFIPNYILMAKLKLINTYWALILPNVAHPFGIFWMRQYISRSIPDSVIESARIDGCNEFSIYTRIILPIIRPGLGALAIFLFLLKWNDLILPLAYTTKNEMFTFPLVLNILRQYQYGNPLNLLMAGSIISIIPILITFLVAQKQFVAGITLGAVKE